MTKHSEKGGGAFHGMEFRDLPLELRSGRDLKTLRKMQSSGYVFSMMFGKPVSHMHV